MQVGAARVEKQEDRCGHNHLSFVLLLASRGARKGTQGRVSCTKATAVSLEHRCEVTRMASCAREELGHQRAHHVPNHTMPRLPSHSRIHQNIFNTCSNRQWQRRRHPPSRWRRQTSFHLPHSKHASAKLAARCACAACTLAVNWQRTTQHNTAQHSVCAVLT